MVEAVLDVGLDISLEVVSEAVAKYADFMLNAEASETSLYGFLNFVLQRLNMPGSDTQISVSELQHHALKYVSDFLKPQS